VKTTSEMTPADIACRI